ncbi:hypothetical protein [Mycobacterium sp. IDR2000157661]|uniref:hypothetical protein n=1 Tax=Mycobacterium sp. IDR2000157661 TaxID=2867005 RepID=UPI001EEBFA90|nr:hypothetical protein [Mycobacterium sp. IDR2000157661]ULE34388.1 hypothetical protein K3G64_07060 [Mycobacterium sp. IDR2000157661]
MGRHSVAKQRRKTPLGVVAAIAPVAVFFAVEGQGEQGPPVAVEEVRALGPVEPAPSVEPDLSGVEIVAAAPTAPPPAPKMGEAPPPALPDQMVAAARYRTVDRSLPVGIAPERGLQVRTILASRAISEAFPEISSIGGVRPDALRWHPNGLALDVMIPNPTSAEGIQLGNEIVWYALRNAKRFGLQDAIWRGVYYTPGGAQAGGYGHFDHVHITTTGGGYPDGDEIYLR